LVWGKLRDGVRYELGFLLPFNLGVLEIWFYLGVLFLFNWKLDFWSDSLMKLYWNRIGPGLLPPIRLGGELFSTNLLKFGFRSWWNMIFCHPKTQFLTTLLMWQCGPLASFRVFFFFFFFFINKSKSCHVDKGDQKLYFGVTMYHISFLTHYVDCTLVIVYLLRDMILYYLNIQLFIILSMW
jgi:hypothetical protein